MEDQKNVLGGELEACSLDPLSGFYRDGSCRSGPDDQGCHAVCAIMTEEFLEFSKEQGNDLSTPVPGYGFPGLNPGDRWCLCAPRWMEAYEQSKAPSVHLKATSEAALQYIPLGILREFGVD